MVARVHPLDVNLAFEDGLDRLGETIDLKLDLSARRDVEVREGRLDLVELTSLMGFYTLLAFNANAVDLGLPEQHAEPPLPV